MNIENFPFRKGDIISHNDVKQGIQSAPKMQKVLKLIPCKPPFNASPSKCDGCKWKTLVAVDDEGYRNTGCWCIWDGKEVCWHREESKIRSFIKKRMIRLDLVW
jgi:hypothetical protein